MDTNGLRPRGDRSNDYGEWADEELMQEARCLYASIFTTECFGTRDCLRYDIVCGILEERGYGNNIHSDKIGKEG
jgi:hypothetical protein